MASRDLPPDVVAALATLLDYMKGAIREAVEGNLGQDASGAYYDAKSAPMGPTSFLRLAREGAFPACKVGRRVLARKADVDAWLEARASEQSARRGARETSADPGAPITPDAFHDAILASVGRRAPMRPPPKRRPREGGGA